MMKRVAIAIAVLFSLLLIGLVALIASAVMFSHSSVGATLANGRSVSADADSWYMGLETAADTATIRTAGRTIVVRPTTLHVDGRSVASIPATTKSVAITVQDGTVTFIADGERLTF